MRTHDHHIHSEATGNGGETFPTQTRGLPTATSPETINLRDREVFDLRIHPVRKRIGDAEVRMLGYNGSIPGPTLHVEQGSEVTVNVTNDGDVETTVHWHGLRLENRYDGVPEETQAPIPPGGTFAYKVQFPDPGFYWYHPHIREDFAQEMGALRSDRGRAFRPLVLACRRPAVDHNAGRRAHRGRADGALPPLGADLHRDGPVRERHAHQRRDRVLG